MIDKEFAIGILEQYREKPILINEINTVEEMVWFNKALEMGIEALKQESVLDKIRAEIEEERDSWDKWDGDEADYYYSYNKCLEIIDKYKAESENEDETAK